MVKNIIQLQSNELGKVTSAPLPAGFSLPSYDIQPVHDSYGRRVNYMRISLTDA